MSLDREKCGHTDDVSLLLSTSTHTTAWSTCVNMMRSRKITSCFIGGSLVIMVAIYALSSSSHSAYLDRTIGVEDEDPNIIIGLHHKLAQGGATGRNLESIAEPATLSPEVKLRQLLGCHDRAATQRYGQRGDYWVLHNYIPARRWFGCADSITYTTHGDHTFLDNLETLITRWNGPVSISVYAPGTDFNITLQSIQYVRNCGKKSSLIQDYVTFHIYFPNKHVPKNIPRPIANGNGTEHLNSIKYNCSLKPPWETFTSPSYRTTHKILYPVNVGRNVAREEAVTHFVLASDIELYPNPGLISNFLDMIRTHLEFPNQQQQQLKEKNTTITTSTNNSNRRKVYPLSIFELKDNTSLPINKTQLVKMLKKGDAVPFHKHVCPNCHNVPKAKEWIAQPEAPNLHVFHVGRRTGTFLHWEPIYIGTHAEPMYDERLSWEGKSDKMTQGYAMCVMGYEFHILDNAFLVHRPGIKFYHKDKERELHVKRTQVLIRQQILPEMKLLYGTLKGCTV